MEFPVFSKSSVIDLEWYPFRNFSTIFWICSILASTFGITCCAIPSILRSTWNSGSSFSTSDSAFHICFQMLGGSGMSVGGSWPSPVSRCSLKQNYPMCLAAAAAAVIARLSWVLYSEQAEASRVFHLKFFPLFEKSLCRCNLQAQSCIQLWHGIWFARTVVSFFVLGLNWSSRRRPDEISTCCGSVLFWASRSPRQVLPHLDCLHKGLRSDKKMVCLPSLVCRPPVMSPDLRIEVTS